MPRNSKGKNKKKGSASKKQKSSETAADVSFEEFARQCDEAVAQQPTGVAGPSNQENVRPETLPEPPQRSSAPSPSTFGGSTTDWMELVDETRHRYDKIIRAKLEKVLDQLRYEPTSFLDRIRREAAGLNDIGLRIPDLLIRHIRAQDGCAPVSDFFNKSGLSEEQIMWNSRVYTISTHAVVSVGMAHDEDFEVASNVITYATNCIMNRPPLDLELEQLLEQDQIDEHKVDQTPGFVFDFNLEIFNSDGAQQDASPTSSVLRSPQSLSVTSEDPSPPRSPSPAAEWADFETLMSEATEGCDVQWFEWVEAYTAPWEPPFQLLPCQEADFLMFGVRAVEEQCSDSDEEEDGSEMSETQDPQEPGGDAPGDDSASSEDSEVGVTTPARRLPSEQQSVFEQQDEVAAHHPPSESSAASDDDAAFFYRVASIFAINPTASDAGTNGDVKPQSSDPENDEAEAMHVSEEVPKQEILDASDPGAHPPHSELQEQDAAELNLSPPSYWTSAIGLDGLPRLEYCGQRHEKLMSVGELDDEMRSWMLDKEKSGDTTACDSSQPRTEEPPAEKSSTAASRNSLPLSLANSKSELQDSAEEPQIGKLEEAQCDQPSSTEKVEAWMRDDEPLDEAPTGEKPATEAQQETTSRAEVGLITTEDSDCFAELNLDLESVKSYSELGPEIEEWIKASEMPFVNTETAPQSPKSNTRRPAQHNDPIARYQVISRNWRFNKLLDIFAKRGIAIPAKDNAVVEQPGSGKVEPAVPAKLLSPPSPVSAKDNAEVGELGRGIVKLAVPANVPSPSSPVSAKNNAVVEELDRGDVEPAVPAILLSPPPPAYHTGQSDCHTSKLLDIFLNRGSARPAKDNAVVEEPGRGDVEPAIVPSPPPLVYHTEQFDGPFSKLLDTLGKRGFARPAKDNAVVEEPGRGNVEPANVPSPPSPAYHTEQFDYAQIISDLLDAPVPPRVTARKGRTHSTDDQTLVWLCLSCGNSKRQIHDPYQDTAEGFLSYTSDHSLHSSVEQA